jgi:SAM-dependent methyltransferase
MTTPSDDSPVRPAHTPPRTAEQRSSFDRFYAAFENRFRGSEAEITERLRVYLPVIRAAAAVHQQAPMVDIGCGRGEWLTLLRDEGLAATGVDVNRVTIRSCRERKLDVVEASAIEYLRALPGSSVGAITAFHVIEHLPFDAVLEFVSEIVRVLRVGGVVILETPDPENVLVGSNTFYLDPTHLRPLPAPLMQFVAEFHGLVNVSILRLHPWPHASLLGSSPTADQFNWYFRGPRDYALVAYRASWTTPAPEEILPNPDSE